MVAAAMVPYRPMGWLVACLSSSLERETVNLFVICRCTRTTALRWQQGASHLGGVVRAQSDTTCRMPSNFDKYISTTFQAPRSKDASRSVENG
jgi:hypothetical protein